MFCFQCQETVGNQGCTKRGVCGKDHETALMMDLLIYVSKGVAHIHSKSEKLEDDKVQSGRLIIRNLFSTITNANFDREKLSEFIEETMNYRDRIFEKSVLSESDVHDSAVFKVKKEKFLEKAEIVGVQSEKNEDIQSLKELMFYGVKGISAYMEHAVTLGYEDQEIYQFIFSALNASLEENNREKLTEWVMKTGEYAVKTMKLLDQANTETYGNPEITEVNIGVGKNPGILISGHDLKDMEELLKQTEGIGVDVYTHGEMLPANYYPYFKKYSHFVGNYGNSWWKQDKEFASFNGPIIMTTNCIIPVKDSYRDRIYTTNVVGYPGLTHIPNRKDGQAKDFTKIIEQAKKCSAPEEIETGKVVGGFAHHQVLQLADKVVEAVKNGSIKRFVVMAGCDGRHKTRNYFTEVAENLPKDTVILTAGCAKYRYLKLNLGDIGGIPRVLDAGQCNDSYSLAVIALKLREVFDLEDVNDLPISFDIAWYEQKAVAVLLALLYLGFKGIRLGPTLPAFISPNVANVLVENFGIKKTGEVQDDIELMMKGE